MAFETSVLPRIVFRGTGTKKKGLAFVAVVLVVVAVVVFVLVLVVMTAAAVVCHLNFWNDSADERRRHRRRHRCYSSSVAVAAAVNDVDAFLRCDDEWQNGEPNADTEHSRHAPPV